MATVTLSNPTTISGACPTAPDGALAHTPANDVDTLSSPAHVCIGGAGGNLVVRPANGGAAVTYTGMPPGWTTPHRVAGVNATGTTATGLILVY